MRETLLILVFQKASLKRDIHRVVIAFDAGAVNPWLFGSFVRSLRVANRVHTWTKFFQTPLQLPHWSASSPMKETRGRLISKTTRETRPRTRWYRWQLPASKRGQNEPRFSLAKGTRNTAENRCRSAECRPLILRNIVRFFSAPPFPCASCCALVLQN